MRFRVGSKVPINVYDGDRPVCQCHNEEDARRIVEALNATGACECPKAAALADLLADIPAEDDADWARLANARIADKAPCPCAGMRQENERMRAEFQEREEEEAAVCPEDVGAVEYIRALLKSGGRMIAENLAQDATIDQLRAELAAAVADHTDLGNFAEPMSDLDKLCTQIESERAQKESAQQKLAASQERERVLTARLESATEFDLGSAGRVMNSGTYRTHLYIRKCCGYRLPKEPMWKVIDEAGAVLCKDGEWEHEPQPSSRDAEFYSRARFDTYEDARVAAAALATPEGTV